MKEVTKWDNNPREMWVWDNDTDEKIKRKVIYIIEECIKFPVITIDNFGSVIMFKHCAEIEEPKKRRMINQEFAWWLKENPTREYKYIDDTWIYSYFSYTDENAVCPVRKDVLIRENGGEWHEPLVEVEE